MPSNLVLNGVNSWPRPKWVLAVLRAWNAPKYSGSALAIRAKMALVRKWQCRAGRWRIQGWGEVRDGTKEEQR